MTFSPSSSTIAALGTPTPSVTTHSFGTRFSTLGGDVFPVRLILDELLRFACVVSTVATAFRSVGLVLRAFRIACKVTLSSTAITVFPSLTVGMTLALFQTVEVLKKSLTAAVAV